MEYLAALALLGGRASTSAIAAALGRTQQELSWLREELIEEGDVYAPRRGQLAMAVPLFSRYVLGHYESARAGAAVPLRSLEEMATGAGLNADRPAALGGQDCRGCAVSAPRPRSRGRPCGGGR